MVINPYSYTLQDFTPVTKVGNRDSVKLINDSLSVIHSLPFKNSVHNNSLPISKIIKLDISDTTSVCRRNAISDITYYDSNNIVNKIKTESYTRFPFNFIEKTLQIKEQEKTILIKHLKSGLEKPHQPYHDDWILLIILITVFLFSLVKTSSKDVIPGITKFFLFRGINDPSSRTTGGLFHWQSTILNFISFLIIGLFTYTSADYYNLIPLNINGLVFWLISLGIIISAVTCQHIICIITGRISGEWEVFREYLLGVYQSYRFSAFFLLLLIVMMCYTSFFHARIYFISGIIVFGIMYIFRILRLLIIFINRNISIFYLILYLCALEILPVLITVKYFTGLV
jgi:hypothetical protein